MIARIFFIKCALLNIHQGERIVQAKDLNRIVSGLKKPAILAGDLNAIPDSRPIEILLKRWTITSEMPAEPTYPSDNPVRKLDYILYHPEDRWEVVDWEDIEEKLASDHRPYVVTLQLVLN